MDASDWAVIGAASVLGFVIIHIAIFAFWIGIRNEIRATRAEIATVICAASVSDVELEQARMRGVMSVIQPQAHDREYTGTRPNPPNDDN